MSIGLLNWMNKKIKKYDWKDVACTEIYGLAAGLFLATVWSDLTTVDPLIYLGIFVLAVIRPIITFLTD